MTSFAKTTKRIQKVLAYFLNLPHKKRKYEDCSRSVHSIRVAQAMTTESEIIVALLHDVLEDFGMEEFSNIQVFTSKKEQSAILALTKPKGADYFVYLHTVRQNTLATIIKIADINDNIVTAPSETKEKYEKALEILEKNIAMTFVSQILETPPKKILPCQQPYQQKKIEKIFLLILFFYHHHFFHRGDLLLPYRVVLYLLE